MIDGFWQLAVVLPQTKEGVSGFPTTMQVGLTPKHSDETHKLLKQSADKGCRPDLSNIDKAHRWNQTK